MHLEIECAQKNQGGWFFKGLKGIARQKILF